MDYQLLNVQLHMQYSQPGRGTIRPCYDFNPSNDVAVIHKALKGLHTDHEAILELLAYRCNGQRQEIKAAYKTLHGKDLMADLKSKLHFNFEGLVLALLTLPVEYDVTCLHHALKTVGTDKNLLIEILVSRTPDQIRQIEYLYKQEFDRDLEQDVTADTGGHFKRMLVVLLQASREQGSNDSVIGSDAEVLYVAGKKRFGADEDKFITILGNRSYYHLRRVFDEYRRISGHEIEECIKKETSGGMQHVLLAIVTCVRFIPMFFAERLYHAMKGAGTDDHTLIRIMVSRSEIDMLDIRAEYHRMFGTSLHKAIHGDTSGDYRKTLLLLCGGDD